jgi:pSer/pThr/pTyr-binding forkhead associated (FHA) protein
MDRRTLFDMASATDPSTTPPVTGATREAPAVSPMVEQDRLRAAERVSAPEPGRYLTLPDGELVAIREPSMRVGRSVGADLVLEHSSVSRRHALIVQRGGQCVLLDDRSMNGVYVNGARVTQAHLQHGDEIALGRVVLRYVEVS